MEKAFAYKVTENPLAPGLIISLETPQTSSSGPVPHTALFPPWEAPQYPLQPNTCAVWDKHSYRTPCVLPSQVAMPKGPTTLQCMLPSKSKGTQYVLCIFPVFRKTIQCSFILDGEYGHVPDYWNPSHFTKVIETLSFVDFILFPLTSHCCPNMSVLFAHSYSPGPITF